MQPTIGFKLHLTTPHKIMYSDPQSNALHMNRTVIQDMNIWGGEGWGG